MYYFYPTVIDEGIEIKRSNPSKVTQLTSDTQIGNPTHVHYVILLLEFPLERCNLWVTWVKRAVISTFHG